jgi:hypothetical protein
MFCIRGSRKINWKIITWKKLIFSFQESERNFQQKILHDYIYKKQIAKIFSSCISRMKKVTLKNPPETNKNLILQIMEDLNLFTEIYILSAEFNLLRSKLRLLHQSLDKGPQKSIVRGLLTFLKRWPKKKIWLRISTILKNFTSKNEITTLRKSRIIESNRFVGHSNILIALTKPQLLSIKKE